MPDLGKNCSLDPVRDQFKSGTLGLILGWYPKLVYYWNGRTPQEKHMSVLLLGLLAPPAVLYALDRGLPIPGTDLDDMVRERIQRIPWLPSKRPLVQFSRPRARYFSGVRYAIGAGEYTVDSRGMVIEQGTELTISPGTRFRMAENAHLLVHGKLIAEGNSEKEIQFVPLDSQSSWGNITFSGEGTIGSVLSHWIIEVGPEEA